MKITLIVDVDGSAVSRDYEFDVDMTSPDWGDRVWDMLDTIEKSKEVKF